MVPSHVTAHALHERWERNTKVVARTSTDIQQAERKRGPDAGGGVFISAQIAPPNDQLIVWRGQKVAC